MQCLLTQANLEPAREGLLGKGCFSLARWTQYKVTNHTCLMRVKGSRVHPSLTKDARGLLSCSPCSFHTCPGISPSDVYLVLIVEPHGSQDSSEFFLLHLSSLQEACSVVKIVGIQDHGAGLDWTGSTNWTSHISSLGLFPHFKNGQGS